MADVVVDAAIISSTNKGARALVYVSVDVGYAFYIDSGTNDLVYSKTSDGGQTWGAAVVVTAGTIVSFDVWFDQWTAGDSGVLIHIACTDNVVDDVFYRALDTSSDTLGTQRVIFAGATSTGSLLHTSIAKMRGGNLYCSFQIDAGSEKGLRRSDDGGVTWTARDTGTPIEASQDRALVFPGNEADSNDCWLLYNDVSTNEITLKVHDDSAETTSESAVIVSATENTSFQQYFFAGAIRHSDGHLIVSVVTERDLATSDHRVFDVNGTGSIVEMTAIATDLDDHWDSAVFIDQATDDIYVAYTGSLDGADTLGTSVRTYFIKSTDGGATWGTEVEYSESASSNDAVWAPQCGPRLALLYTISGTALRTNYLNSLTFAGSGVTAVEHDSDLRWSVLQNLSADSELAWSLAGALASVQIDATLQWSALSATASDATLQWSNIASLVGDVDLQWSILEVVLQDVDARWSLLSALSTTSTLEWQIDSAGTVSVDMQLRWSLLQALQQDSQMLWGLNNSAAASFEAAWSTLQAARRDVALEWSLVAAVVQSVEAQWSLLHSLGVSADLRWGLVRAVVAEVQAQWSMGGGVLADLDLRWSAGASLEAASITLRWHINPSMAVNVLVIPAENRVVAINAEARSLAVAAELERQLDLPLERRILGVASENRVFTVPHETRVVSA